MVANGGPSLSEALTRFVAAKKNIKNTPTDHQELGRFVAWCGRSRTVAEVSPAEVAEYAQYIGLGGIESAQRLNPVKSFLSFWKEQGWIENALAAHLRVPRSRRSGGRRAGSGAGATGSAHLSPEGYARLAAQVELLKGERALVVEDIRLAMSDKDFRENAPLEAAKERQGFIESRIRDLEISLATAEILSVKRAQAGQRSAVGARVSLRDAGSGKQVVYTLVDVREADAASGRISTSSPVGQALLDKVAGDEVTINVPRGTLHYIIEKVAG